MSSNAVRPVKQFSGGCAMLFGLPFIVAGLAIGWFLYFPVISTWWSARGWEEVPCWIENAEMKATRGSKGGTTYKTEASYRYQYHGRTYHSEEVSLSGGSDNIGDFQERAHAQIRAFEGKDRPFRCYVNPAKPEQAVLFRELRWGLMLMMSVFPMVFPLAGFAVSIGAGWEARKAGVGRKLEAQHPGEPWRWRPEWSGETIQASKNGLPFILGIAGWILLVQAPLALAIIVSGELSQSPLAALALLPSLLALIPLSLAWKRYKTRQALGKPSLWLKQTPVSPGHTLEGELRLDRVLSPREVIQVRLLCQRKITRRAGKGISTVTETIWEHTETLSAGEARREMSGVALPLRIEIPRGLPCAIVEDAAFITGGGERHEWSLEVRSASGGKAAVLPLPVFVTGEEVKLAESDSSHEVEVIAPSTEQLVERMKIRGVHAEFDAAGIPTLIDCPPGRFRAFSIFLLIFGAIWLTVFLVMASKGAPWIFRIIWGITSPLIIGGGLWTLLHRRLVEITADELRIQHSVGPFYSWKETYAPRHFVGFTHDTNMQSGNQFYYRVRAETTFGKTKTLIDGITESVTAETLAKRLEDWRKRG
ncbi:DUF3592 domain-containing protein [Prosthecobacter sp.]|uniref:DUF3592 domain-containing protein n=1 Tax=Prosthecobacter sp. TaxID=1965333 RepID=UPI002ABB68EA|nr:DUF3592 domain-containing protein [Prosthecobacter sp.]MDZ4406136.1 DUF3592 domain-containing protein [Prosthecobacter sp.]